MDKILDHSWCNQPNHPTTQWFNTQQCAHSTPRLQSRMSHVKSESDKVCRCGYTLTYFEGERGRAEAIRMMMSLAGQPYEEVGISISDWFSSYKQSKYNMEHEHAHDIYLMLFRSGQPDPLPIVCQGKPHRCNSISLLHVFGLSWHLDIPYSDPYSRLRHSFFYETE